MAKKQDGGTRPCGTCGGRGGYTERDKNGEDWVTRCRTCNGTGRV